MDVKALAQGIEQVLDEGHRAVCDHDLCGLYAAVGGQYLHQALPRDFRVAVGKTG